MSDDVDRQAERFRDAAAAGDLAGAEAILSAVKVQKLLPFTRAAATADAMASLAERAASDALSASRLRALALLGKLDNGSRRQVEATAAFARLALKQEPPPLTEHGKPVLDAEGREYVATLMELVRGDWVTPWAARALADETNSNNLRASLSALLLDRAASVTEAFQALADAVPGSLHDRPGTKEEHLTRSTRAARLLEALQPALRLSRLENGDGLAPAVNRLLTALLLRYSSPRNAPLDTTKAIGEAIAAALALLNTLVRTRFSIATDPEAYASVRALSRWAGDGWPAGETVLTARHDLARSVREAMALLAQMDRVDRDLLALLILLLGERDAALRLIAPLAATPGLSPANQAWLRTGGTASPVRVGGQMAETAAREADPLLAAAGARAARLREAVESAGPALTDAVRTADGTAARTLGSIISLARATAQDVAAAMAKRGLELFGTPGEETEFDRLAHEPASGTAIDTVFVLIVTPGTRRIRAGREPEIVRRAIVRPVIRKQES